MHQFKGLDSCIYCNALNRVTLESEDIVDLQQFGRHGYVCDYAHWFAVLICLTCMCIAA